MGPRLKEVMFGAARDIRDGRIFHSISLVPFLAWVGLGADGLSSSAYGPEEAYKTLGQHVFLAVALAALMATTVLLISAAYRGIIQEFPHGGGGYVVATKLLGERAGVVSGCALLVDYVLTITISIAAAGDAIFSFLPPALAGAKLTTEAFFIIALIALNIRGVRESAIALAPIFMVFVITHVVLIVGGILARVGDMPTMATDLSVGYRTGVATLGYGGMALLFLHAYSLGGGTYTGIEAVSNGVPIMREPQVRTAGRTMVYMGTSLAFTATGLLVCYLLWRVHPVPGKTLNAVLAEAMTAHLPFGRTLAMITIFSEGVLLIVAAQAGFVDGPRVLANMAIDNWMPRRFAALSDRLTTMNGVLLMGAASLAALFYTRGDVGKLVVMYSINVFLTFSLSMFGMAKNQISRRKKRGLRVRSLLLFGLGFLMCATILVITVIEKFVEGGWLTLLVTTGVVALCFAIQRHYRTVNANLAALYEEVRGLPWTDLRPLPITDRTLPTAAVLVGSYGGIGIHTVSSICDTFRGFFKNLVFLSVGVIDSGGFKGEGAVEALEAATEESLRKYCALATELGLPSCYRLAMGTDAVAEAERLCRAALADFPAVTFFAGKVIFEQERWYQRLLHNETATALQKRLYGAGAIMVILPARATAG